MSTVLCGIVYVALTGAFYLWSGAYKDKNRFIYFKSVPIILGFLAILLYGFAAMAILKHSIDIVSYLIGTIITCCCVNAFALCKSERLFKAALCPFIKKAACIVLVLTALEFTVFNISSFTSPVKNNNNTLPFSSAELSEGSNTADSILIDNDDEFIITYSNLKESCENVYIQFEGKPKLVTVSVGISDINLSQSLLGVFSEKLYADNDSPVLLNVHSKELDTLKIGIKNASGLTIREIGLNKELPIQINYLRLIAFSLICLLVQAIKEFKLYKAVYNNSPKQLAALILVAALCCGSFIFVFCAKGADAITPYKQEGIVYSSPYYQMFDAFQKGQLNLDIPVDQKLIDAGDKVYDPQYRSEIGANASWDRAFYNGKYYSYFGTAPLFLVYYPIYFITGALPTDSLVCTLFSMLISIFGFMAVSKIAMVAVKKSNFLLVMLSGAAIPFACGIYILSAYGDFYNLPKLCGIAFLFLLIYLTLSAYKKPKCYKFLMCGITVGLIAASRPNLVIAAMATAPFFISVLLNKTIKLKSKLRYVAVFIVPVALFATALMIYNYARFGSLLEFGTSYQLTVNNISLNNVSLAFLGPALYHYFFQMPDTSAAFPYVSPSSCLYGTSSYLGGVIKVNSYSRYFYMTGSYGVFALPLNWLVAFIPAAKKRLRISSINRWFIMLCVALSVLIAFTDFCMAGVAISYVCDIAPIMAIAAIIILLYIEKSVRNISHIYKVVYILLAGVIVLSVLIAAALAINTVNSVYQSSAPALYSALRGIFTF